MEPLQPDLRSGCQLPGAPLLLAEVGEARMGQLVKRAGSRALSGFWAGCSRPALGHTGRTYHPIDLFWKQHGVFEIESFPMYFTL